MPHPDGFKASVSLSGRVVHVHRYLSKECMCMVLSSLGGFGGIDETDSHYDNTQ